MTMLAGGELVQREIDRICSDGPNSYRRLPRDLSEQRVGEIQRMFQALDGPVTASEVAARTHVSRVTARRYLEYLVTVGQATTSILTTGPGRPSKTYELAGSALR
jgi:response regulator of citrate/malate metabolism